MNPDPEQRDVAELDPALERLADALGRLADMLEARVVADMLEARVSAANGPAEPDGFTFHTRTT